MPPQSFLTNLTLKRNLMLVFGEIWTYLCYLYRMYEAGQKSSVGCIEVPELRITWALIFRLWASPFHWPLFWSDQGTKWSVAACQGSGILAARTALNECKHRAGNSLIGLRAPICQQLHTPFTSLWNSNINDYLFMSTPVYLLLGLMSSFHKVWMEISCSERRNLL